MAGSKPDTAVVFICSRGTWYDETKYIVGHSNLIALLEVCRLCSSPANVEVASRQGAYIRFNATCTHSLCRHTYVWETTDRFKRRPMINLLLAATCLFSGSLPTKFFRSFTLISVLIPSLRTFFQLQKDFLIGVSIHL